MTRNGTCLARSKARLLGSLPLERMVAPLALVLCSGLASAVSAADITVDGTCSLVNAINASNSNSPVGGCPAGSAADWDTLTLTSDVVLTSIDNATVNGASGLPRSWAETQSS